MTTTAPTVGPSAEYDMMNALKLSLSSLIDMNELLSIESQYSDGRVASTIQEHYIINLIKRLDYEYFIPKARWWFDIAILHENGYIPINIKITSLNTADNIGSYSILAYSMSNIEMKYDKNYSNKILDNFTDGTTTFEETNKDYWFLIINKQNIGERVYINSFKGITRITPNKSNLPFQINWKYNLIYSPKTTNEMFELIKRSTQKYAEDKTIIQKHIQLFGL